jgi:glycosyltransferase involved in cell wall biosynthesis
MLEAALCSTPSIAFRPDGRSVRTAADEIILDGRTGYLVEPATRTALAEAICRASSLLPEQRLDMGMEARRWVAESFDWTRFVHEATHGVPATPPAAAD